MLEKLSILEWFYIREVTVIETSNVYWKGINIRKMSILERFYIREMPVIETSNVCIGKVSILERCQR